MELTNNRSQYTVTNADTTLKLTGELTINANKAISSFSGYFSALDGTSSGNFNYSENGLNVDKHIFGTPKTLADAAITLLDTTVTEIKTQIA